MKARVSPCSRPVSSEKTRNASTPAARCAMSISTTSSAPLKEMAQQRRELCERLGQDVGRMAALEPRCGLLNVVFGAQSVM